MRSLEVMIRDQRKRDVWDECYNFVTHTLVLFSKMSTPLSVRKRLTLLFFAAFSDEYLSGVCGREEIHCVSCLLLRLQSQHIELIQWIQTWFPTTIQALQASKSNMQHTVALFALLEELYQQHHNKVSKQSFPVMEKKTAIKTGCKW